MASDRSDAVDETDASGRRLRRVLVGIIILMLDIAIILFLLAAGSAIRKYEARLKVFVNEVHWSSGRLVSRPLWIANEVRWQLHTEVAKSPRVLEWARADLCRHDDLLLEESLSLATLKCRVQMEFHPEVRAREIDIIVLDSDPEKGMTIAKAVYYSLLNAVSFREKGLEHRFLELVEPQIKSEVGFWDWIQFRLAYATKVYGHRFLMEPPYEVHEWSTGPIYPYRPLAQIGAAVTALAGVIVLGWLWRRGRTGERQWIKDKEERSTSNKTVSRWNSKR